MYKKTRQSVHVQVYLLGFNNNFFFLGGGTDLQTVFFNPVYQGFFFSKNIYTELIQVLKYTYFLPVFTE